MCLSESQPPLLSRLATHDMFDVMPTQTLCMFVLHKVSPLYDRAMYINVTSEMKPGSACHANFSPVFKPPAQHCNHKNPGSES